MLVQCPSCAKQLNVPDTAVGKKAKCPACTSVFEIIAPPAVAAAPNPSKTTPPPPPVLKNADEDRPRRRQRDDDEDDDRPRAKRSRDEQEYDDEDGPSIQKNTASRGAQDMAAVISLWLKLACVALIAAFLIGLINTYLTTASLSNLNIVVGNMNVNVKGGPQGNMKINMGGFVPPPPSPLATTLLGLVGGLIIYGPCLAFMYLGSINVLKFKSRGIVMTGIIIATVLGSLIALGAIWQLITMLRVWLSFFQPIALLTGLATAAVLLIAGIKGLTLMGKPAMKEAFGVNNRPRRSRDRDRDEEDEDEDRPRRRRSRREEED
jgi:hypothetical protein